MRSVPVRAEEPRCPPDFAALGWQSRLCSLLFFPLAFSPPLLLFAHPLFSLQPNSSSIRPAPSTTRTTPLNSKYLEELLNKFPRVRGSLCLGIRPYARALVSLHLPGTSRGIRCPSGSFHLSLALLLHGSWHHSCLDIFTTPSGVCLVPFGVPFRSIAALPSDLSD